MQRLKNWFNTPVIYFRSPREKWIYVCGTGLFVFCFLTFFQPFGVNNYDPQERITPLFAGMMLSMGLLVVLSLWVNEFGIRKWFPEQFLRWHLIAWFVWSVLLLASVFFFYYNFLGNWHDFLWSSYVEFIGNIAVLSLFPFVGSLLYLSYQRGKHQPSVEPIPISPPSKLIRFTSDNQKDHFAIASTDLLYLESQDNYSAIYYVSGKEVKKSLIRSSLKRFESELEGSQIIRCHRSFLVNLDKVKSYKGNRHGLSLNMDFLDSPLPVSRSYVPLVLEKLQGKVDGLVNHPS